MNILSVLGSIVKPISDIVDNVHTSDEERLEIKAKLFDMQNQIAVKVLEYETSILSSKAKIITAEAQGQSWLQRSWRPITMLTFLALVVLDSFGFLAFRLADQAWTLLQLGIGGYVVGRSVEKVVPKLADAMSKSKG